MTLLILSETKFALRTELKGRTSVNTERLGNREGFIFGSDTAELLRIVLGLTVLFWLRTFESKHRFKVMLCDSLAVTWLSPSLESVSCWSHCLFFSGVIQIAGCLSLFYSIFFNNRAASPASALSVMIFGVFSISRWLRN